jgi:chromosome partitioning protein
MDDQAAMPISAQIGFNELRDLADRANQEVETVRGDMLAPSARKAPPVFTAVEVAEFCGIDKAKLLYAADKKGTIPTGAREGSRREWTLEETRKCVRHFRKKNLRDPSTAAGVGIGVANFKGGVSKTTTAVALAQGLSLRGHNVLVIDCDPQGSATTLFGILPDTEVEPEMTMLSICAGDEASLTPAIRPSYWDGIDIVCAAPALFGAEFMLPARQTREGHGFQFWRVLDKALEEARAKYDVIIMDTPPSLSYLTINALMAAQGVLMPLPPNTLDFASSAQFWNMFTDMVSGFHEQAGTDKKYHFVDVLLSRVDRADSVSQSVRNWIINAYGSKVLPVEIPKTSIAATASAEFGTVYDMNSQSVKAATLKRARDAYELVVDYVETQIRGVWADDARAVAAALVGVEA